MKLRLLYILAILWIPFTLDVQAQMYLWPSDSGRYLSSTFGETRSAHFHAGLDIKTWGQEGYQVFASKEGTLFRILVTERGYGNALYLKHADGSYTVYAHLQRFNESFQAIADSLRLNNFVFELDARVDSMGIKVNQGEVIGFTGSTGIGPPHLHFEVRDSLQQPMNALKTGFDVRDTRPPIFSSILIEPLESNSLVQGKPVSYSRRPGLSNDGTYDFGAFNLSGKAGVAVNVFDQANRVPNAYAVYSLALIHNSDTLFYEELDQFSYEEDDYMFLDRAAAFGSSRRGYQRLFKKDGPKIPFYKIIDSRSQIDPALNPGSYTIIASDYYGNQSTASFTISNNDITSPPLTLASTNPKLPLNSWYWNEDWVSPDLKNSIKLDEISGDIQWTQTQQLVQLDSSALINFARIIPGTSQKVTFPDGQLKLRFGSEAFYDTLTVASYHKNDGQQPFISVQPAMLPAASSFGIEYYMGDLYEEGHKYRMFKVDPNDGDLSYLDSELVGRTIHAQSDELGDFTVLADDEGPTIRNFRIYKTKFGAWRVSANVEDELTGVDSSTAIFLVNDKRGIAEYDYEEDLLIYYLPGFTPAPGNNSLSVQLRDKAGNLTSLSMELKHPDY